MSRQPRFEVVHTGARKWHARFRAANGQVVWTTESYKRRRDAVNAICSIEMGIIVDGAMRREVDER